MKLTRRIDQALVVAVALILVLFFGCLIKMHSVATFAEGEEGTFVSAEAKYVTFYDNGNKLTVKTEAKTVAEALQRAKITINTGDKVEPALDTEIDMDNFFVNIYRARPVVVKDGVTEKYLMTASYD